MLLFISLLLLNFLYEHRFYPIFLEGGSHLVISLSTEGVGGSDRPYIWHLATQVGPGCFSVAESRDCCLGGPLVVVM